MEQAFFPAHRRTGDPNHRTAGPYIYHRYWADA
jgi:hypothetical protein